MSKAYHPQTDWQTERVNGVLEDTLRHFIGPFQQDWDEVLAPVELDLKQLVAPQHLDLAVYAELRS